MSNAGNALLNVSNSANSAINGAVNSAINTVQSSNYGMIFLAVGIVLLLVLAYLLYSQQVTIVNLIPGLAPPPPADWREIERREVRKEIKKEGAGFGENWCFVGEDVTGRWCVKVPRPDACSPERLFSSRPGCELVTASPLPLGLIAKGGAEMKPLVSQINIK
jgi:hypothetical protein